MRHFVRGDISRTRMSIFTAIGLDRKSLKKKNNCKKIIRIMISQSRLSLQASDVYPSEVKDPLRLSFATTSDGLKWWAWYNRHFTQDSLPSLRFEMCLFWAKQPVGFKVYSSIEELTRQHVNKSSNRSWNAKGWSKKKTRRTTLFASLPRAQLQTVHPCSNSSEAVSLPFVRSSLSLPGWISWRTFIQRGRSWSFGRS